MVFIECPRPALDKLVQSGLAERLLKSANVWWMAAHCHCLEEEPGVHEIEERVENFLAKQGHAVTGPRSALYTALQSATREARRDDYQNDRDNGTIAKPALPLPLPDNAYITDTERTLLANPRHALNKSLQDATQKMAVALAAKVQQNLFKPPRLIDGHGHHPTKYTAVQATSE